MPYPVKCFLEIYEDMEDILLELQVLFADNSEVENLLCGTASFSIASLLFGDGVLTLWFESVTDDLQHGPAVLGLGG